MVIEFVKSAHADLIDRQKLLRNLMIVELVVQILKNHNPESSSDRWLSTYIYSFLYNRVCIYAVPSIRFPEHVIKC